MISSWPLLSVITFLPLTGVLFLLLIRGNTETVATNARLVALWVSGFTFLLSLSLYFGFDAEMTGYQFEERADWISGSGISYHLGVDGISMPFHPFIHFPDPAIHSGKLEEHYPPRTRLYDRLSGAGSDDVWYVRLAGYADVLPVL